MIDVIRRLILVLIAAVGLSACGTQTGPEAAVVVGDVAVSREDIVGYAVAQGQLQGAPAELFAVDGGVASGDLVRFGAGESALLLAYQQAFEEAGAELDAAAELEAEQQLKLALDQVGLVGVTPESPGYDLMVLRVWISGLVVADEALTAEVLQSEVFADLISGVEIESRIGEWDPETGQVFAP